MVLGGTVDVEGKFAKRKSIERASSRSLKASMNAGYRSLIIWSKDTLGLYCFSSRAASVSSFRPKALASFFSKALWSLNLASSGSWRRYCMSLV